MIDTGGPARWWAAALALILLAGGGSAGSAQAEALDLDAGWHFWFSGTAAGDEAAWLRTDPSGAQPVDVPHSWNLGRGGDADGLGWYSRTLALPAPIVGQHLELHFGAVFYRARIWVNGVLAGTHEGGHTAFDLDVSRLVHAGENRIVVCADNRPGFATIPGYAMRLKASGNVWYDWWRNGGLTRDVSLRIADGGLIRRQTLRQAAAADRATARADILIENVASRPQRFTISSALIDPDGRVADRAQTTVSVQAGRNGAASLALVARDPQLWQVGAGKLYRVETRIADEAGRLLDTRSDAIGFRTIEIRDRRLLVNGRPVRLTGIARHQDSPWEGAAETRGTIRHDWRDMAALHVTLTRPIHYPQPQAVFDEADRAGILLIPEIPIWQMKAEQLGDPRLLSLARQMWGEVVAEAGNHPSVMAWSVMNECDSGSPQGAAFVRAIKAHLNRIDPGRLVTFADSDVSTHPAPRTEALTLADFVMANAYFGTWSGGAEAVRPWLDAFAKAYPDKLLVISEFGWPGPFSANSAEADRDRTANLREQLDAFAAAPFVGGAIFWDYQDYRSNKNLFAGKTDGAVDHGLVDVNRQRRPSFFAWEARNRPASAAIRWINGDGGVSGFRATVSMAGAGSLPSYPLIGYRVLWRAMAGDRVLLAEGEMPLPRLDPGATLPITGQWGASSQPIALSLDVLTPLGLRAGGGTLDYLPFKAGSAPYPPDPAQLPPETRK